VYAGVVKLAAALSVIVWTAAPGTSAIATTPPIPPSQLVAHARELPGFKGAKVTLDWSTSALEWGHFISESDAEAKNTTALLLGEGFQEGVQAFFRGRRETGNRHREALSEALLFATPSAAEHMLRANVQALERRGFKRSAVPSIPGAVGLDVFNPNRHGGGGNVLFSSGRCFFLIGNSIHDASTRAQLDRAPIAAAVALYGRTKQSCA
jgi:hypothetical protein